MSILIDDLIRKETGHTVDTYINACTYRSNTKDQKYYLAKPRTKSKKFRRLLDAFRVLIGKYFAVHYNEDK